MFVSSTLTPALCAMWLRKEDAKSDHSTTKTSGWYARLDAVYGKMLHWALHHRPVMIGIAGAVALSAAFLYPYVGKELVPDDDQGEFSVNIRLPRGTSYQRTEEFIKPIEKEVLALPALQRVMQNVNSGFANFNITMLPLEERNVSQQELMIRARQRLRKYQGARISVSGGTDISGASSGGRGGPGGGGGGFNRLNILIQGPDIEQLQGYTVQLMEKVREIPGVVDVDTNFEPTQPELRINVDRARAADLGVNIDALANNLRTMVGGEEGSEFKDGDDQFKVLLRLDEPYRRPEIMANLLVAAGAPQGAAGAGGVLRVKVSDVAQLKNDYGPASIDRYNRQRQISINANLQGVPLNTVLQDARKKVDDLRLRPGYQAVFGGSARTLAEASNNFAIAMIPIALGRGAGAGSRASMAVTILGGQVLCLLLTLLVTPVVYSYFDDLREWRPMGTIKRVFTRQNGRKAEGQELKA